MMHGCPTPNGNALLVAFVALIDAKIPYAAALIIAARQTPEGCVQ